LAIELRRDADRHLVRTRGHHADGNHRAIEGHHDFPAGAGPLRSNHAANDKSDYAVDLVTFKASKHRKGLNMKHVVLAAAAGLLMSAAVHADDPAPAAAPAGALPTHVDTTVVGSSVQGGPGQSAPPTLDNGHDFVAGAPELLRITKRLNLSPKQQAQLHEVIEKADAGAAVLIEREHDVSQMIAATTPADPAYAKLIADQSAGAEQWTENRESLRRHVLDLLTPAQQKRFEELQASATPASPASE
jgi:Spy/CpxP family protein refolding chaperone